jgi:transglutaminase-like putative cysteine protease
MFIRAGYEIAIQCPAETPLMALLSIHPSRVKDLRTPAIITSSSPHPLHASIDEFGNVRTRTVAPAGILKLSTSFVVEDPGLPDEVAPTAAEIPVSDLPDEALMYLMGSRYCETDRLSDLAWSLFGGTPRGWPRVQAIVDYVHNHLTFGYPFARCTRTAFEGHQERVGVCRDFAHLAVTLCRCMNIPARYATGYLGDIGVPPVDAPMDFSAWFEVYLGGRWYTCPASVASSWLAGATPPTSPSPRASAPRGSWVSKSLPTKSAKSVASEPRLSYGSNPAASRLPNRPCRPRRFPFHGSWP